MQLFSRKKNTKEAQKTEQNTKRVAQEQDTSVGTLRHDVTRVLVRPHITEKAAILADSNGYVFEVTPDATKTQIKRAVREIYKKEPVKVNIAKKPDKTVLRRKGRGVRKGLTKAYVFLKKGETIDIV